MQLQQLHACALTLTKIIESDCGAGETVRNGSLEQAMRPHVIPEQTQQHSPQTSAQALEMPLGPSKGDSRAQPFEMWAAQKASAEASEQVRASFGSPSSCKFPHVIDNRKNSPYAPLKMPMSIALPPVSGSHTGNPLKSTLMLGP